MPTPPGLSMKRRSSLPPPDACTSTSSYPRPASAGSITASRAAMDASLRVPQTKNGPKPIFDAVPLKFLKFNRIWQLAPLSRRQIARQLDRAVANADQTADAGADRLEQAPHFAFAPLPEHHPVPAIGTRRGAFVRRRNARKRSPPIVKMDASRQLFKVFPAERTLNAHRIFALDLVARVHQTVGELAGIGEQQHARAERFWRFPQAAAAPPGCAARDRRETCAWWRKAPAGPGSRAGPRRRSSRGSPAPG